MFRDMKNNSLNAIRTAFKIELKELQKIPELPEEGHWEYRRDAAGGWGGRFVPKPSFINLHVLRRHDKVPTGIEDALKKDYPEYLQLVGTPLSQGLLQPDSILHALAYEAHTRFGTFVLTDAQIETILADVSNFFDRKMVRLRLYAPALNLYGPREIPPITFPGKIILRPTTDEECTRFYGGNPIFQIRQRPIGLPDFVFVKEIDVPKIFGSHDGVQEDKIIKPFQEGLDFCMFALSTFKDAGAVGYDGIHITSAEFTLGFGFAGQQVYGSEHIPLSRFDLTPEEAPKIGAHAKALEGIHSTLEMASQRLVDSARRTKLRDAIVDAVIGLESILLANTGDKTELRFRFSLHYASLFSKGERKDAFYTARDLYDLRSTIAHGSPLKEEAKINGKTLKIGDVATLVRSVLQKTISIFMSNAKNPDFMQEGYWLSKELGFEEDH
jgi:hypothetical protein